MPDDFLKLHTNVDEGVFECIASCRSQDPWKQLVEVRAKDLLEISERVGDSRRLTVLGVIELPDSLALH